MEGLKKAFGEIIQQLVARGWEMPVYVASIGSNGGSIIAVYEPPDSGRAGGCRFIAQALKPEGIKYPINTLWVNSKGDGVRVVLIKAEEAPKFLM